MDSLLVITIIAKDRPGLVESLAAVVANHGGNWLESRMARLGGQFAGILRIEVPVAHQPKLLKELQFLEARGVKLTIEPDEATPPALGGRLAEFTLVGQDRPGIVRQISEAFAQAQVNVEELETERTSAAMSGEMLFQARANVQIPANCDTQTLRLRLEKIASDLMVDVKLTELP